jgi:hypothetical protein
MATQIWKPSTVGRWFTAANWASGTVPQTGDEAIIASGTPEIVSNTIVGCSWDTGGDYPAHDPIPSATGRIKLS